MKQKLISIYLHHNKFIITIVTLLIFLSVLIFLYNYAYLTLQNTTKLYELNSNTTINSIDTEIFDEAQNSILDKKNSSTRVRTIKSPF